MARPAYDDWTPTKVTLHRYAQMIGKVRMALVPPLLAHARYSGRPAAVPATADPVTAEASSREVIAFGFWPGDAKQTPYPAFYSYTAPEPEGLAAHGLEPPATAWADTGNGHLPVLPYDDVRGSDDPHNASRLLYESAYRAGSTAAGGDVDVLERR